MINEYRSNANAAGIECAARARARAEHQRNGGTGDVPAELLNKHIDEVARNWSMTGGEESTPEPQRRQSPMMQPSRRGQDPDLYRDDRRTDEVRTVTGLDGRQHRLFAKNQRMQDYERERAPFGSDVFFDIVLAQHVGNHARYRNELDHLREMGENVNTSGGILVPDLLSPNIIDDVRAANRILQAGATTMEMGSDHVTIPRITADPTISEVGENSAIPFSDSAFDGVGLTAKKIGVVVSVSKELIEDGMGVGALVQRQLTLAMAQKMDDLAVNGSTTGSNFTGLVSDATIGATTGIASNLTWDHLLDAMNEVELLNGTANAAILHPSMLNYLRKLKSTSDEVYLEPPAAIAGLMLLPTTKIASGTAVIGDYSRFLFGIRRDVLIDVSDSAGDSFQKDQVYVKATMRLDTALTQPLFYRLAGATYS